MGRRQVDTEVVKKLKKYRAKKQCNLVFQVQLGEPCSSCEYLEECRKSLREREYLTKKYSPPLRTGRRKRVRTMLQKEKQRKWEERNEEIEKSIVHYCEPYEDDCPYQGECTGECIFEE